MSIFHACYKGRFNLIVLLLLLFKLKALDFFKIGRIFIFNFIRDCSKAAQYEVADAQFVATKKR